MPIAIGVSVACAAVSVASLGTMFWKIRKTKQEVDTKINKATTIITQAAEQLKDA